MTILIEQLLNGLQYSVMLFLIASGFTVVFGFMGLINLAHGSLYMLGAFVAAAVHVRSGSFLLAVGAGIVAAVVAGLLMELLVLRRLYSRGHLDHVLATFGLILFFNEFVGIVFGRQPIMTSLPSFLSGWVQITPDLPYPTYRLAIIAVGIVVALVMYLLLSRTRVGMLVRAGTGDREMVRALGVDIWSICSAVFAFGAILAGLAGAAAGPVLVVQIGMGDEMLILAMVIIVIGGIGSLRGALVGALIVGVGETLGRAFLPGAMRTMMSTSAADALSSGLSSIIVFVIMASILLWRPKGLFPVNE